MHLQVNASLQFQKYKFQSGCSRIYIINIWIWYSQILNLFENGPSPLPQVCLTLECLSKTCLLLSGYFQTMKESTRNSH